MTKNKNKRLFTLFAILFVAIFSVGCVFATACKKNKESDEEPETPAVEHVHDYQPTDWAFSADYTTCTATLTCVSTTGECDAPTNGTVSATVSSKDTAATCTAYAYTTYTATYGGNIVREENVTTGSEFAAHTYTDDSVAHFDWTNFVEDDLSGVTATVECDVCHTAADADSVTVEAVQGEEDTYVATAKIGNAEIVSAKHKVGEVAFEELLINISSLADASYETETLLGSSSAASVYATASSNKKATIEGKTEKTDASGRLTFTKWLKFGGAGATNQCSLKFELTADADITVWMVSSSGSDKRIVNLFTADSETVYQTIGVGSPDAVNSWTVSVPAGTYYMGSASSGLNFFAIEVTEYTGDYTTDTPATTWTVSATCENTSLVYDAESEDPDTATVTATVLRDGTDVADSVTLSWSSSDESVATVSGGVVAAEGTGTAEITVSCTYGQKEEAKATSNAVTITVTDGSGSGDTGEGGESGEPSGASVTLSEDTVTLAIGGQDAVIEATVTGYEETYQWTGNEWSSSDEEETIIKITQNNNSVTVEAVGTGTATVTVTLTDGTTASCTVTVSGDIVAGVWEGTAEFGIYAWGDLIDVDLYATATVTVEEKASGNTFKLEIADLTTGDSSTDQALNGLLELLNIDGMESLEDMAKYFLFEGTWTKTGDIYWVTGYIDETNTITLPVTVSYINGQYKLCLSMETTLWSILDLTIADAKIGLKGVEAPEEGVTDVSVTYDRDTFTAGNSATATVAVTMAGESGAYDGTYTWTSSDESVFTVSGSGATATLSFVSAESAVLKVELNDGSYVKYVVTVEEAPSITLEAKSGVIFEKKDDSGKIEATVTMPDGSSYSGDYTWTSSDESVATVTGGLGQILGIGTPKNEATVTIVGAGTTIITVTLDDGTYATMTITIPDSYEIEIDNQNVVVTEGETLQLTATVYKNGTALETVTLEWSSSDASCATVSDAGLITGVAAGTATITVKYTYGEGDSDFVEASVTVTVISKAQAEAETRITAENETATLNDVGFTNQEDISFVFDHVVPGSERTDGYTYDEIWISAQGTASAMTKEQAEAFTSLGDTFAHDPYVIVTVNIKAGETLSTSATNSTTYTEDTTEAFVIKVSNYGYWQFKITTESDTVGTMYVIDFTQMTPAKFEHTAEDEVRYVEGEYYYVCTECGETFGEALTSAEGIEIAVATAEEINAAAKLDGTGITIDNEITGTVNVTAKNVTITVNEGATLSNGEGDTASTITVKSGAGLTIEGAGTIDTIAHGTAALYVEEGATVYLNGCTFTRSEEKGTRTWDGTAESWTFSNGGNSYYTIVNHGTMEIGDNVTVENSGAYSSMIENGWYYPSENVNNATATLTINGGSFEGGLNTVKNDDCGELIITGGTFKNSVQGVIMNYSSLEISGGTFEQTGETGWTVYNVTGSNGEASAKISGGEFSSLGYETVINCEGSEMTISGGKFTNSETEGYGTVVVNAGTLTIENGEFEQTVEWGWTVANYDYYGNGTAEPEMTIDGGTFKAAKGGIVIDADDGTIVINGGTFSAEYCADETYWEYSVVVEAWGDGEIIINGGTFVAGYADNGDGTCNYNDVLYAEDGGTITVYGGVFRGWIETWEETSYGPSSITLYGGYFNLDPSDYNDVNFVAEGYMAYGFTYEADGEIYTMYGVIRSVAALGDEDTFADVNFSLDNFEYHDIVINEDGSIEYQITATGGMMSSEQNVAFGGGDAQYSEEGDLYVSFKIWVNAGETISWVKDGEEMTETFDESGWFVFVIKVDTSNLPEGTENCSIGKHYFTISDDEGNSATVIVNFGHIDFPEGYVLGGGVTEPSEDESQSKKVTVSFTFESETIGEGDEATSTAKVNETYTVEGDVTDEIADDEKVELKYSANTLDLNTSSVTYNGTTYVARVNLNGSNKYFTIEIPEGATNVSITVILYNSTQGRTAYIGTELDSTETDKVVDSDTTTATGEYNEETGSTTMTNDDKFSVLSGDDLDAGTYYIYVSGGSMYVCEIIVSYEI